MRSKVDKQLLYNIARMYYVEGRKQDEIATIVKRSRSSISMLLTEAREVGIVEIKVRNPLGNNRELSNLFETKFNLQRCYVIPTTTKETDLLIRLVAEKTIEIFNEELKPGENIGIAWGRTCYEFMSQYNSENKVFDVNVVPLIGASDRPLEHFQLNEMVRLFAEKIPAEPNFLHAPVLADTEADKELYMSSAMMKRITQLWAHLDAVILSIGIPNTKGNVYHYLGNEVNDAPEFINAIGDVCGWPLDANGKFLTGSGASRLIACPPKELKRTEKVFGLVAGIEKRFAIRAGLRSGVFDFLVIDEQTARAVLNIME